MYMRWSLFLLSVCVALSACSMTPENPSETSEIFSGLNEDLEEKPLEVLYHGGNPLTPEDTLSKVLIVPLTVSLVFIFSFCSKASFRRFSAFALPICITILN